jgi:flavin reductase (DIM6/NTAB) family NADH-FMN oxidoreductase RutF
MDNRITAKVDTEQLRTAMRGWSVGVTVVTTVLDGIRHGMTVNSFTSISLDPPLITISLQGSSRTYEMIAKSRVFGLTILSAHQAHISDLFAGKKPEIQDRFAGLKTQTLVTGAPLIVGGLAWLDCRITQTIDAGMNTLIIAEVLAAQTGEDAPPLVYHTRKYWTLKELK